MFFKPLPIHTRVVLCVSGAVALLVVIAFYLQSSLERFSRFSPEMAHRTAVLERIEVAPHSLEVMEIGAKAYLQTGDLSYLEPFYQAKVGIEKIEHGWTQQEWSQASPLLKERKNLIEKWINDYAVPAVNAFSLRDSLNIKKKKRLPLLEKGSPLRLEIRQLTTKIEAQLLEQIVGLRQEEKEEGKTRILLMWCVVGTVIFLTLMSQQILARSIVSPLQQLRRIVGRLQAGDYSIRAHLKTGDEIGGLATAFNSMAQSIEESREELEKKNQRLFEQQEKLKNMNLELEKRVDLKTEELQEALAKEEAERTKWERIIQRMPDGLILFNPEGEPIHVNEAALIILGHADFPSIQHWMNNMPGAFAFQYLNHQTVPLEQSPFYRVFRGEIFSNYSLYVRAADNSTRLISFSGGPVLKCPSGKTQLSLSIFRDVTEELALRRALEEKNSQLHEASRLKDQFLATLSHELRTPLTPILSATQLMYLDETFPKNAKKSLKLIERNARSLSQMIDEMLDLSAIMNAKLRLNKEPVEMNEWVRSTLATLQPAIQKKHLTCEFQPSTPKLILEIDPARMTQVLVNLLSNAIKYTEKGGNIEVKLTFCQEECWISIHDTGIGMSRHELEGIFEMFHQAGRGLHRHLGGLGIGLAVAKSLAELHGGSIQAKSAGLGQGSTFTIRLPLLQKNPTCQNLPQANGEYSPSQKLLRGRRILLVEDSQDTLKILSQLFLRRECQVVQAQSAEEGLQAAEKNKPDIIISDLGLPQMDGFEFIGQLRRHECFRSTVTVSFSGWGREEDKKKALAAGFDAHLVKPIDIQELDSVLSQILQEKNGGNTWSDSFPSYL